MHLDVQPILDMYQRAYQFFVLGSGQAVWAAHLSFLSNERLRCANLSECILICNRYLTCTRQTYTFLTQGPLVNLAGRFKFAEQPETKMHLVQCILMCDQYSTWPQQSLAAHSSLLSNQRLRCFELVQCILICNQYLTWSSRTYHFLVLGSFQQICLSHDSLLSNHNMAVAVPMVMPTVFMEGVVSAVVIVLAICLAQAKCVLCVWGFPMSV